MSLRAHPTIEAVQNRPANAPGRSERTPNASQLKRLVLDAGADDVGFVDIGRPELDDQRSDILAAFPRTRTLISYVVRMNREPIRTPARSIANLEFHHTGEKINDVGRSVVRILEQRGIRALNPSMGFPMEMDKFPGKIWVVSHKPVAVAAGLGQIGIHRNLIHPRFGNFVLLGTILTEAEVGGEGHPIDFNPCLECKLCVAACPVGAISPQGDFNFSACYTHNYREFMGGFTDWTEQVADSSNKQDYRQRVTDAESASMWQSLSFGANYKAAYCLSVCPAGEEVIAPFLESKRHHIQEQVKPLQEKKEVVYVLENSDAADHVARRFPNKTTKVVGNSLRVRTVDGFRRGLPLVFQPRKSKGVDATFHFTLQGSDNGELTVEIRNQEISVSAGLEGTADLHVTADADTWFGFLAGEKNIVWALARRKAKISGSPKLLLAFGRCFPSP